jgi:D-glycero-D-manno-heptose 1,7-bisphosphate phosphatase
MNKAIFIDRDGVVNKAIIRNGKPLSPQTFKEFIVLDKVNEALEIFKSLNLLTIIVTNQPDIKTKKQKLKDLNYTHQWILNNMNVDDIYSCFHDDDDNCNCRKPNIGMLIKASKKYQVDLEESYIIGDRWKDVKCGQIANCKEIFFIDYEYEEIKPVGKFKTVTSLFECSNFIKHLENNDANQ